MSSTRSPTWHTHAERGRKLARRPSTARVAASPLVPDVDLPLGEVSVYQTIALTELPCHDHDIEHYRELDQPVDLTEVGLDRPPTAQFFGPERVPAAAPDAADLYSVEPDVLSTGHADLEGKRVVLDVRILECNADNVFTDLVHDPPWGFPPPGSVESWTDANPGEWAAALESTVLSDAPLRWFWGEGGKTVRALVDYDAQGVVTGVQTQARFRRDDWLAESVKGPIREMKLGDIDSARTIFLELEFKPTTATVPDTPEAAEPAIGVLLTHEQAWRMKGLTLGRLMHSLPLAPGEVTQVAVAEWQRDTLGRGSSSGEAWEQAAQTAERRRDLHEVARAVATETESGGSSNTTSSVQTDAGGGGVLGGLFGVSGGVSTSAGTARGVQFNAGHRSAAARAHQDIDQATHRVASNRRGERASVVQEVSESSTERFSTRVVANYNHMHALNMQYFEVLQVLEYSTEVVDAERLLFLPMRVLSFYEGDAYGIADEGLIKRYARSLSDAARARGDDLLAERLLQIDLGAAEKKREDLLKKHDAKARVELADAQSEATKARDAVRAHERALDVARHEERVVDAEHRGLERALSDVEAGRRDYAHLDDLQHRLLHVPPLDFGQRMNLFTTVVTHRARLTARARQRGWTRGRLDAQHVQLTAELNTVDKSLNIARDVRRKAEADLRQAEVTLHEKQEKLDQKVKAARRAHHALVHNNRATKMAWEHIAESLERERLSYNQAIWMRMTPLEVAALVEGRTHDGTLIWPTLDPEPIAVTGNLVGFRWRFPHGETSKREAFVDAHVGKVEHSPLERTVSLPTGGVFAEAVLGLSNCAEKLDMTRFWRWDEHTIPILPTPIANLHQQAREQAGELAPTAMGDPSVGVEAIPDSAPPPPRLTSGLVAQSLFRDMSGGQVIGDLLDAAQKATGEGAEHAQRVAHDNISAYLDHLEQMLPQVAGALQSAGGGSGDGGGLDLSNLGALKNFAEGGEGEAAAEAGGLDVEGLMSLAEMAGMLL